MFLRRAFVHPILLIDTNNEMTEAHRKFKSTFH
nr:MAG TPA: hypothetical protein [Caudoviricetes sp.]